MQNLLLSFNAVLLIVVLIALFKGTRVAYLTGLRQGIANGRSQGYQQGLQTGLAAIAARAGMDMGVAHGVTRN